MSAITSASGSTLFSSSAADGAAGVGAPAADAGLLPLSSAMTSASGSTMSYL
jgi:hypothetical protein